MKNLLLGSDRGQTIILFALGVIVLLGFTALAVDGGMLYADRRHAQNAADAASLAGGAKAAQYFEAHNLHYGVWDCSGSGVASASAQARTAAVARAADNGYQIDEDISDENGVETLCGIESHGSWNDKYLDVRTMITAITRASFVQFVFKGVLRNEVEAIARVRPRTAAAFGFAIVALREDCPSQNTGGVHYRSGDEVRVYGGGIFSNACMVKHGNTDVWSEGTIGCTGSACYTDNGASGSVVPAPEEGQEPIPGYTWDIPEPDCSSLPYMGSHNGGGTIIPGRYTSISIHAMTDELIMQPGLYCVSNGITYNGGSVSGSGVTIYLSGGDFVTSGNVVVNLTAPLQSCTLPICPPAIPGILIFMAYGNSGTVSLLGDTGSDYQGLVFAPHGTIEAGGTSGLTAIHTQLVGDAVNIHGSPIIEVHFDENLTYYLPSMIELNK